MKLRSLIFLSSLALSASCANRPKPRSNLQEKPQVKLKMSMAASNQNTTPLNGSPAKWSMEGKCASGFPFHLNQDNTFARQGDTCDVMLMSLTIPHTAPGKALENIEFTRHSSEHDFDHVNRAARFVSAAHDMVVTIRLAPNGGLMPPSTQVVTGGVTTGISKDSEVQYILSEVKQGADAAADLAKIPINQIAVGTLEAPRFSFKAMSEQEHKSHILRARYDFECMDPLTIKTGIPLAAEHGAALVALSTVGAQVGAARAALNAAQAFMDGKDTTNPHPTHAQIETELLKVKTAIALIVPGGDVEIKAVDGTAHVDQAAMAGHIAHVAAVNVGATNAHKVPVDATCGAGHPAGPMRPADAYKQMEVCLNKIGWEVSRAATLLGLANIQCGTNTLDLVSYRVSPDTLYAAHGRLSVTDLDLNFGKPCATVPALDHKTVADPKTHCSVWQVNESVTGFKTVKLDLPYQKMDQAINAILVLKASVAKDYSYAYFALKVHP